MATMTPQIFWPLLLLLIPLLLLLKKKQHVNKTPQNKQKHLPPSPPKLPLIGNLHQLGSAPHRSLLQLSQKYGPVMLLHLGRIPTVVVSSAEAAKDVFKTNDLHCCSRPTYAGSRRLTYNYLDVAFSPYSDYWREIRKICVVEFFSVKRVQSYRSIREEEVAKMVKSISDHSSSSVAPVDVSEMLFALVASILFRVGFGTSLQSSNYKSGKAIHKIIHDIETMLGGMSGAEYFPAWIGWITDRVTGVQKKFDRITSELDVFFQQLVDDHLTPGRKQEHEDIIDVLLRTLKEQTGLVGAAQLGHASVKAVLMNLFLGGIDTGAITMWWAMAEIVKNPRVMKKAQQEVRNCIGNKGLVSESDTEQLEYLKKIIKETLRLHPPAPMILPREAMSHFKIQGYDVDPKTLILVNEGAIARDPKIWNDPEEFFPERFDGSSVDFKGQHYEYLPFGAGRRMCPGIYMATTTLQFGLANLLYWFDWKLPNGMKVEDLDMEESADASLTVPMKNHLLLVPQKFYQN
ncbi:hypothetical protein ACFX13_021621 [Malus domestica]